MSKLQAHNCMLPKRANARFAPPADAHVHQRPSHKKRHTRILNPQTSTLPSTNCCKSVADFFPNVEPIQQVKSDLSYIIPNSSSFHSSFCRLFWFRSGFGLESSWITANTKETTLHFPKVFYLSVLRSHNLSIKANCMLLYFIVLFVLRLV